MAELKAAASLIVLLLWAGLTYAQSSPSDFTTGYRYDLARRLTGTISPDPDGSGSLHYAAVRNTYDTSGRLVKVETGELAGWQAETVAPAAWSGFSVFKVLDTVYDVMDRKIRDTVSAGGVATTLTQYSYDGLGRPVCTAVRQNPTATMPGACAQQSGTDRVSQNSYNVAGQLIQVRRSTGSTTDQAYATYSYTANGKQEYVVDANGNKSRFVYDGFDRLSQWQFPSATRASSFSNGDQPSALGSAGAVNTSDYEQYGYDANGNRTSLRKRDGQVFGYVYDALNRMISKDAPGSAADVGYSYDLQGHQTTAVFYASNEVLANAYDGFGRLTSSTTTMGGVSRTLGYEYDADGNRTKLTFPDGTFFLVNPDGLDRFKTLRAQNNDVLRQVDYDPAGRRSGLYWGNASSTGYGYDGIDRMTGLQQHFTTASQDQLLGFAYSAASQVTSETRSNDFYAWTAHYNVSRGYTTNGLNQYSNAGPATFAYDPNGNLTSDGSTAYAYDAENRLVSATGGLSASLVYDPNGRLFQTSGGSAGVTQFLYDGDALVAEYDGANHLLRRYLHGPGVDEPLVWLEGAGTDKLRWLHADHQGSIVAVSDASGNPLAIDAYDEYGVPGTQNQGRFQYTGQIWLPELGMYHYKARIYSPTLGRFLQTDPIGYKDQINLYAYVGDDPVNRSDPSGMLEKCTGTPPPPKAGDGAAAPPSPPQCGDDGTKPDKKDEIVVTAKRHHKIRMSGPEQFFSVTDVGISVFDADSAQNCGGFVSYRAASSKFGSGDPGHSHPSGSSDPNEDTSPAPGPDDGMAANKTGRAYMVSPVGTTRFEREANGAYSATLVQGSFGASNAAVLAQLSRFGRNSGSEVSGGATAQAQNSGKCTPMRTR